MGLPVGSMGAIRRSSEVPSVAEELQALADWQESPITEPV